MQLFLVYSLVVLGILVVFGYLLFWYLDAYHVLMASSQEQQIPRTTSLVHINLRIDKMELLISQLGDALESLTNDVMSHAPNLQRHPHVI